MLSVSASLKDPERFKLLLNNYLDQTGVRFAEGCALAAAHYLRVAEELVPVDTGALRQSGNWHQTERRGWAKTTYIGYGYKLDVQMIESYLSVGSLRYLLPAKSGSDESNMKDRIRTPKDYAVFVHEIPYSHAEGVDHFLEEGLNYYLNEMFDIIADEVKRATP